jgi:uncharacterized membrane protein YbjE (DUF340 family)
MTGGENELWLPFICLAVGALLAGLLRPWANVLIKYSLFFLLLMLGTDIGINHALIAAIPRLGLVSLLICILSSAFSIGLCLVFSRVLMPNGHDLQANGEEEYRQALRREGIFILTVLTALLVGIAGGYFFLPPGIIVSQAVTVALVVIYLSVGVGLKEGLAGLKDSPHKFACLFLPLLITIGSVAGGLMAGGLLQGNYHVAAVIGGGVTYYSLTMAVVTQKAGVELGFVAFLANFFREVLTFFLTPWLARYSKIVPLALGGASTMDTTLAVMKRSLGEEYALVGFASGVILSIIVPVLLITILSF